MIYLDHAAATPASEKVLEAMMPYFAEEFFNPSAAYLPAKKVASEYDQAKATIAHAIGAKASDLVMTAGATEANNLAFTILDTTPVLSSSGLEISGTSYAGQPREPSPSETNLSVSSGIYVPEISNQDMIQKTQALYLSTEHDSVRKIAERYGGEPIDVDRNGRILLDDLKEKITDDTVLISVALVNNELGTIQPLSEIAAIIREVKLDRLSRGIKKPLYLHSDASQALNLLNVNVARLGVDLLTLNAAKVYGPKGVGALYVSHDTKLKPLTYGGGQEQGLRSGTENVPGTIGFAKAVEEAEKYKNGNRKKYANWRKILLSELTDYELINKKHALDNFIVLCYNGIDAERLIFLLEEKGVYVSTGAACAASKGEKSHVLRAIGLSDSEINGSLRLTLGDTNSEEQIHEAAKIINEVVAQEKRRMANG